MLQARSPVAHAATAGRGHKVLLETSGERPLARVLEVVKIVDVKCPDSGEAIRFAWRIWRRSLQRMK